MQQPPSPASPGLRVLYPSNPLPASSPRAVLEVVAALTEAVAEASTLNASLSTRVGALEEENALLRASLISLAARVDALTRREPERSPPRAARTIARIASPPVRTLS